MTSHYFKTAFRYLTRHKTFAAINLIGLATAMCACFYALLYVNFELSYDAYHEGSENIYRVVTDVKTTNGTLYESTPVPMASALEETFPEIRESARVILDYMMIQHDRDLFAEEKVAYADPSVFSVFTLPLVAGNAKKDFEAPFTIILSETAARKYFGKADPLGETLVLDRQYPAVVAAVMKDIPHNSHFRVDILVSMSTLLKAWNPSMETNWTRFNCYTYLLLHPQTNASLLAAKLPAFVETHMKNKEQAQYVLGLERLRDVYLYGKARGHRAGAADTGNIHHVIIFSLVALFVLFIACFNFINLTTAFSIQRTREVGVRKVLGASRKELIFQFLIDALFLSMGAFLISLALSALLVPVFNEFFGKMIISGLSGHLHEIPLLLGIAVSIGLMSGVYPAFFLSGFKAIGSLKGAAPAGRGKGLRQALVALQFSISIMLIFGTIVVYAQLDYMQHQQLGFNNDRKLVVDFYFNNELGSLKEEFTKVSGVEQVSLSSCIPGRENHRLDTRIENADHELQDLRVDAWFVDPHFFRQYEIGLVAGRLFSRDVYTDSTAAMIINEEMVRTLGYHDPVDAIGKVFTQLGKRGEIIGVVRNFHARSFHQEITPLTFQVHKGFYTFLTFTLGQGHPGKAIADLKDKWSELVPDQPFNYFFADEAYNAQYEKEARFSAFFFWFATLAIVLSCLGLTGLCAFSIVRRTKEIGIRKVMGSSVHGIVYLLSKEFLILVLIASMAGIPIGWAGMEEWLSGFAYRIATPWWAFVSAFVLMSVIAFVTISFQTIRAAVANPVESLRSE